MSLDSLDEHTLKMSRDELLIELNDQIEITREMMRLHREECKDLNKERVDAIKRLHMWKYSFYVLVFILIVATSVLI